VDHLLGLQSRLPLACEEEAPPHHQVFAAAAVSDFLISASEFPFNIVSTSPARDQRKAPKEQQLLSLWNKATTKFQNWEQSG
jgi:hypothetical protein